MVGYKRVANVLVRTADGKKVICQTHANNIVASMQRKTKMLRVEAVAWINERFVVIPDNEITQMRKEVIFAEIGQQKLVVQ